MTQIINFFLIAPSHTLVGTFYKSAHKFREGGYSVLIHDTSPLIQIINDFKDDVQFRVLVHMDFKGKNNVKEIPECQGYKEMKHLKKAFPNGNFTFFTRENEIFPSKGAVEGEKLTYENFEIVFGDEMTNENFFNNIPINTKGEIENGITHPEFSSLSNQPSKVSNRIVILSALTDDELKPFRSVMSISKKNGYEECEYKHDTFQTKLLLYAQNRMAMVDASIFTSKVITQANPKAIVMAGVCGGRKSEKVKLYDIIIPELALDIVTGQYKNGDFIPYGYSAKSDEDFIKYIKAIVANKDFIHKEMYNLIPNEKFERENEILKTITIHFDVMACGPFVLKTDNFLEKKALQMNHKIKGFEMESYAVLRSVELLAKDKLSLIVKSVMDYTDSKKGDTINETASPSAIDNEASEEAKSEVPVGERIKDMAAYMSSICVRALLPHIEKYINDNNI